MFYWADLKEWVWGLGEGWSEGFRGSLRGSLKVQGEIVMPYLRLDLWIAGGELLVNLHARHWNSGCAWWLPI